MALATITTEPDAINGERGSVFSDLSYRLTSDFWPRDAEPQPRQVKFLLRPELEVLYGGAAGGGKSLGLMFAATQYMECPDYSALLLRRTFPELSKSDGLIEISHDWFGRTKAKYNSAEHRWTFPSGATLEFGHMQHETDKHRFQGAAYRFIGFDEVTHFTQTQYEYLFSRLRKATRSRHIPLRIRATANPDGEGLEWVRNRFIVEHNDPDRVFIPATLDDNPGLDRESYIKSLDRLDPVTRARLLNGDWNILPSGNKFKREWFTGKFIPPSEVPHLIAQCRYWDLAATEPKPGKDPDWTAGVKLGVSRAGIYYILHAVRTRTTPHRVEELIRNTAEQDGKAVFNRMEQEPGSSGVNTIDHYRRRVLAGYWFDGDHVTGRDHNALRANPFSSQCEKGNVFVCEGDWTHDFMNELCSYTDNGPGHDDQAKACFGAFDWCSNVYRGEAKVHVPSIRRSSELGRYMKEAF